MKAINIKWDTDGNKRILQDLPTEIIIPDHLEKLYESDRENALDEISDWLSEETGFCHDGFEIVEVEEIAKESVMVMRQFILRYTADGYCCDFRFKVNAESLNKAKELWKEYVDKHEDIEYSWNKAEKAVKYHHGGYIEWKDNGRTNKTEGVYELGEDYYIKGSDHLED